MRMINLVSDVFLFGVLEAECPAIFLEIPGSNQTRSSWAASPRHEQTMGRWWSWLPHLSYNAMR